MDLRRISLLLLALLAAGVAFAQPLPPLPAPQQQYLPQHQTLSYSVDWRVFPAGTATFHIDSEGATQRINANGDSIGAVSLLFKVVDRFQSSFDRKTGCSQTFAKQLIEGRRQIVSTLQFQYGAHKQVLDEKNLVKGTSHHQEAPIPSCVTDLMSAIFVAGAQPLEVGQNFTLPIADAMRVVAVTFKTQAREEIKTAAGTFQTIRVEPTADAGVVKNRGNIWIWYSDDNRHLPVQMRARLFWGTITMRLASVEPR
ncbi:MAG: hypothetical protein JWM54_712 [Acidobacteriaceae bacterium]|jgi:hypothetical protein|nr:hypothetical protein [Acidobacteriaceae bacterium]